MMDALQHNGFSNISVKEIKNFSESVGGKKPELVLDISAMILEDSGWSEEEAMNAYKSASKILGVCGIGFGNIKLVKAKYKQSAFRYKFIPQCKRERGKLFTCKPGIEESKGTSAELAVASFPMGRPAIHMAAPDTSEWAAGWSTYSKNGLTPLTIRPPITNEEQKNLDFYNQTLHSSLVSKTNEAYDRTLSHEIAHQLIGSCGDESPKPQHHHGLGGLMSATETSKEAKDLCPLLRKSSLLRKGPYKTSLWI
ncbi:hypothetical protein [Bdellovibrio sp. BCCA]|uniref:hypothetical protein n=1 Tax=Bdellovibrio sp. BCCA TaxID=3136281 RepID=UPI0030F34BCE